MDKQTKPYLVALNFDGQYIIKVNASTPQEAKELVEEGQWELSDVYQDNSSYYEVIKVKPYG